jgi:hypothetical protein
VKSFQARLEVTVRRWVDDSQPGFVERSFTDARGREWLFVEKAPVVSGENLWRDTNYPKPGQIACTILSSRADESGRTLVRIDTDLPWHIETATGRATFDVHEDQIELLAGE